MADKNIGSLSPIDALDDDSLIPVEQQGEAHKLFGRQFREFARQAASDYEGSAKKSADRAESAQAQVNMYANNAAKSANDAAGSARKAEESRRGAEDSATLSKSWATGNTGIRGGESTNNSRYYAEKAEFAAVRAPAIGSNGNWLIWDNELGAYKDSGLPSRGKDGKNGAVLEGAGLFGFDISEAGELILHYAGDEAPNVRINEAGELIYTY